MAATAVIWLAPHEGVQLVPPVPRGAASIAADGGVALARAAGCPIDAVVGDLDSARPADVDAAVAGGAVLDRHDVDKDRTDFELALGMACRGGVERVVVIGGHGGRLDHLAANLAVMTSPSLAGVDVEAWMGQARVTVVRSVAMLEGAPGMTVSLLAWHGAATGVSTTGLRWALDGAVLAAGSACGTSNEFLEREATVSLRSGVVAATCPDASRFARAVEVAR